MVEQGHNIDKPINSSGSITESIKEHKEKFFSYEKIKYKDFVTYENLQKGLERTKSVVIPEIDGLTKADITEKRLRKLHSELVAQTYQPSPSKRVAIPKTEGGVEDLGVASQIDKDVQAALLFKLEPILEKEFLDCSYGFRPGTGCHHVLKKIKYEWKATTWVISVDIKKSFETLNDDFLLERLGLYCDQATVELVRKLIKVGYVNIYLKRHAEEVGVGTPQGSLISPIMCNLYLHELDKYITKELMPLYTKGKVRAKAPGYASRYSLSSKDKEFLADYPELEAGLKKVKHNRKVLAGKFTATDGQDPDYRRLHYVRYADDLLLGFIGPKSEGDEIIKLINAKLKTIHLEVNEIKSKVLHSSDLGIEYLGMYVRWFHHNKIIKEETHNAGDVGNTVNKLKAQAINTAHFRVPVDIIIRKLVDRGIAKAKDDGTARSTAYIRLSVMEDKEIVLKFNTIIRRLLSYYSCINHRSDLWKIFSILRKSCALTLAHKHKENSAARVFSKLGPSLIIRNAMGQEVARLQYPESLKTSIDFKLGENIGISPNIVDIELDKIQGSHKTNLKTAKVCEYEGCDSTENIEAHSLNPLSSISKRKDLLPFEIALVQRKRKVIMLCKKHHNRLYRKKILNKESAKLSKDATIERLGINSTGSKIEAESEEQSKPLKV